MFKTYKGIWIKTNEFLIENGPIIFVAPYQNLIDKYKPLFPMECYILVTTKMNIIKEVLCI